MFAQLGDIEFDLISSFNGHSESQSYNYAEHERIGNKPLLQFMGLNLGEQSIKMNFHSSFCIPETEIKKLKNAAASGEPQKFIKGNGQYLGAFIITEITSETEQSNAFGDLISIQAEIRLKEYPDKVKDKPKTMKGLKKR